ADGEQRARSESGHARAAQHSKRRDVGLEHQQDRSHHQQRNPERGHTPIVRLTDAIPAKQAQPGASLWRPETEAGGQMATSNATMDMAGLREAAGKHLGYTNWQEMTQERVNEFADATD